MKLRYRKIRRFISFRADGAGRDRNCLESVDQTSDIRINVSPAAGRDKGRV